MNAGYLFAVGVWLLTVFFTTAGLVGLYFFKRRGPRTAAVGTALAAVSTLLIGPMLQSGQAAALSYVSIYCWSIPLVLSFVAPYRGWFERPPGT